jgi:hypothetical protein
MAAIVRATIRKIAEFRRQTYGKVLQAQDWMPALAGVLRMAEEGKYFRRRNSVVTPLTRLGLTKWSLYRNCVGSASPST